MEKSFRQNIKECTVAEGVCQIANRTIACCVVSRTLKPKLVGFADYVPADETSPAVVILSEDVPPEFRKHVALYQVLCAERQGQRGGCVQALLEELKQVPPEMIERYTCYRSEFFECFVEFYRVSATVNPDFLLEIVDARDYLRALCY